MKAKKIKLYATLSCPYCKMEKAWLDENKIAHDVIFVDLNPFAARDMVAKTGQMGVPVTEIHFEDNKMEYVIGFDKQRLAKLLE